MDHILSELSTKTLPSWVALHGMAYSFIELDNAVAHVIRLVSFYGRLAGKEFACNEGDLGLIPGLGRSSGEGNSYLLQYSGLESTMDIGAWQAMVHGVTKRHD